MPKFAEYNTQVLGISIDHIPSLQAWAESLGGISFPLLSDFWPHGAVAVSYGVLRAEGDSERAIFIIDEKGILRYIDIHDIDEQPENEVLLTELARLNPGKPALTAAPPEEDALPEADIVMYCTNWCPACKKARAWFEEHQVEYVEVNINNSPKAVEQVKKWAGGNRTTPTLNIRGTVVVGWDEKRVAELVLGR